MKITHFALMSLALVGCANPIPQSANSSKPEDVIIERDSFKQQTLIKTPLYLSRKGFTDTFPVQISWQALSKDNKTQFIQLYVTKMGTEWGFYQSANGEDGYKFDFLKADGLVTTSGGMVTTNEHFALGVSRDYLQKMTTKDWQIKVYGRRDEGVFIVPAALSRAFLERLTCHEERLCCITPPRPSFP